MKPTQNIVFSGIVTALALWVCWVSFTQQPAQAFLFPRLIAVFFTGFALWTFVEALLGKAKGHNGITKTMLTNLWPGLLVMVLYVFWAAKALGFYTAAVIGFFILFSLYDPASHCLPKTWAKRIVVTAFFVGVMYGLFAVLLKVYTPREVFF